MIIGSLIGLAVGLMLILFAISRIQAKVRQHNSSALRVSARGRATMTLHVPVILAQTALFTVIGAIIGYFC